MTGEAVRAVAGRKAPLVIGLVVFLITWGLSGCGLRSQEIDRDYVNSIPDKESYLLGQLDRKFESPDVHCELGRFYHSEGKWQKAHYHFNTALGFDPAHRPAQAAYIKMLAAQGNQSLADGTLNRYQRQLWQAPLEMVRLAMALSAEKMDPQALSCFAKALQIAPNSFEVNKQVGMYYLKRDDNERAQEYLKKSFELNPNQPEVAGALGRLGVAVEVPVKYQAQTQEETQKESGT